MKLNLEITLTPSLTPEEIAKFRDKCEADQVAPEARLAELIRQEITNPDQPTEKAA